MRLYRLIGTHGDFGYAEIHGDENLDVPGMWRPATRVEYIGHYLLKARFSYADLAAIALATGLAIQLGTSTISLLFGLVSFNLLGALLVLFLEKRFR